MFKNKWKPAFWICFFVLTVTSCISCYIILDQGVTLTYMEESYGETDNDLLALSIIINETDLSKNQIKKALLHQDVREYCDTGIDTIALERIWLAFDNGKLEKVIDKY